MCFVLFGLKWFGATANWMCFWFLYECNQWPNTFRYPEKYENTYQYFQYFSTFQSAFSLWKWKYLSTFSAGQRPNWEKINGFYCCLAAEWLTVQWSTYLNTQIIQIIKQCSMSMINVNRSMNKVSSTAGFNSQRKGGVLVCNVLRHQYISQIIQFNSAILFYVQCSVFV